jgi:poly-gamma-glutamate capsule biosynthesis protein CapA/YwtB (metallophosphatase superfamily)
MIPGGGLSSMQSLWKINLSKIRQRTRAVRCLILSILASGLLTSGEFQPSASLVLLGDIMLGRGVAEAHAGGDWETVLQSLQPITRAAGLAAGNLESPIGCDASKPSSPRSLAAPPEAAWALRSAGIDVVSTANNHALDAGTGGLRCTEDSLAKIGAVAIHSYSMPLEINVHGLRIAFLALNLLGENPPDALAELEQSIRRVSADGAITVVSLHWGMEYQAGHDSLQEEIAGRLVEAGADILWGHHPHVVQEMEWRKGTLILYSLGNAVFDQPAPPAAGRGSLVWVSIGRDGIRWAAAVPFAIDPRRGVTEAPDYFSIRFSFPDSIPHGI